MKLVRCLFLAAGLAALAALASAQPPPPVMVVNAPVVTTTFVTNKAATFLTNLNNPGTVYVKARPKGVAGIEFHYYKYTDNKGNLQGQEFPFSNTVYKITEGKTNAVMWYAFTDLVDGNGNTFAGSNWFAMNSNTADFQDPTTRQINPAFANPLHPEWANYTVEAFDLDVFEINGMPFPGPPDCP